MAPFTCRKIETTRTEILYLLTANSLNRSSFSSFGSDLPTTFGNEIVVIGGFEGVAVFNYPY